jgi:hypothetical protein
MKLTGAKKNRDKNKREKEGRKKGRAIKIQTERWGKSIKTETQKDEKTSIKRK